MMMKLRKNNQESNGSCPRDLAKLPFCQNRSARCLQADRFQVPINPEYIPLLQGLTLFEGHFQGMQNRMKNSRHRVGHIGQRGWLFPA